jgi:hypothetical protein
MGFPPGPSKPGTFIEERKKQKSGRSQNHLSLKPTECPHKAWALFSAWERPSRDILQKGSFWQGASRSASHKPLMKYKTPQTVAFQEKHPICDARSAATERR